MNIDISNCDNLKINEQKKIANKLGIPEEKINSTNNLCRLIKRYYNNKFLV